MFCLTSQVRFSCLADSLNLSYLEDLTWAWAWNTPGKPGYKSVSTSYRSTWHLSLYPRDVDKISLVILPLFGRVLTCASSMFDQLSPQQTFKTVWERISWNSSNLQKRRRWDEGLKVDSHLNTNGRKRWSELALKVFHQGLNYTL